MKEIEVKILKKICVECGLYRHPMAAKCPRCESHSAGVVKVEREEVEAR